MFIIAALKCLSVESAIWTLAQVLLSAFFTPVYSSRFLAPSAFFFTPVYGSCFLSPLHIS